MRNGRSGQHAWIGAVTLLVAAVLGLGPAASPTGAQVVLNEIDADTPDADRLEFIELFGPPNYDLAGWVVVLVNGYGDFAYAVFDLDGYRLDARGFFLLGNELVQPHPDIVFANNLLQNGPDAVVLCRGEGWRFPYRAPLEVVMQEAVLVDAVVYRTEDQVDPDLQVLLLPGQEQIDENGAQDREHHSNQRCPQGAGGLRSTDAFLQAPPTPKDVNANLCMVPVQRTPWTAVKRLYGSR